MSLTLALVLFLIVLTVCVLVVHYLMWNAEDGRVADEPQSSGFAEEPAALNDGLSAARQAAKARVGEPGGLEGKR